MIRVDLFGRKQLGLYPRQPASCQQERSPRKPPASAFPNSRLARLWSVDLAAQLFAKKFLKRQWLVAALERQQQSGEALSDVFDAMGVASRRLQLEVLSEFLKIPAADLGEPALDPDIMELIPRPVSHQYLTVAISRSDSRLTVAMADPTDAYVLELLALETGLAIKPVLGSPSSIRRALACRKPDGDGDSPKREEAR